MRPRVAVATVQGKAYFLIVNELKQHHIPFLSLMPGDSVRAEIRVVITTQQETHLINHSKIVVFSPETDPEILGIEVLRILQGKETYETFVIGVDPGEVFGIAVVADEFVVDTENCDSVRATANKIRNTLRTIDPSRTETTVKIGNGVPVHKDLLETLDAELQPEIKLEIVGEAGTNRFTREDKHRRGFRHMASAIQIARRTGYIYQRRRTDEQDD
ncbi:MAG TPA: hypothetical protein VMD05_10595 [Candidatus Nanoarchaeia archaeon]|nr:hypothetical protein [Candidatus Nanoarchaeia archaeon]